MGGVEEVGSVGAEQAGESREQDRPDEQQDDFESVAAHPRPEVVERRNGQCQGGHLVNLRRRHGSVPLPQAYATEGLVSAWTRRLEDERIVTARSAHLATGPEVEG